LRKERDLTQERLGLDADIEPAWISKLESGYVNPTWGTMGRLADALGVTLAEIARRADEDEHGERSPDANPGGPPSPR
jgi:transcriptional regulator with XRE-family HTH domain